MQQDHKTVFISYRRSVSAFIARAIFLDLREHGYDVFMDVESNDSEKFDKIILNQIEARAHFILILTPGTVKRFVRPGDWLRREIEYAIYKKRNIIPLFVNDFDFDDETTKYFTGNLVKLLGFDSLPVTHAFFDAAMEILRNRFLRQPVNGIVKPTPSSDQSTVKRKIQKISLQPAPTKEELSGEEYLNLIYEKYRKGNLDGAMAALNEAIRLNPGFAEAYSNRGIIYFNKGNLASAIADCNEALRLNPQFVDAYFNRGLVNQALRDLDSAIADYNEALRLNPQFAAAYSNRGKVRYRRNDVEGAISDYDEAIRLQPLNASAYVNRGEAHFTKGNFNKAWDDFRQANNRIPAFNCALCGLAITHYVLDQKAEAKRIWHTLLAQDHHFRDADWVGKEFLWPPELIEAARQLIAEL